MGEMKKITAVAARELTEQSTFLLKSAYKWIEEAAKRNNNNIPLCKECYDEQVFTSVVAQLVKDGYNVEEDVDSGCVMVKW